MPPVSPSGMKSKAFLELPGHLWGKRQTVLVPCLQLLCSISQTLPKSDSESQGHDAHCVMTLRTSSANSSSEKATLTHAHAFSSSTSSSASRSCWYWQIALRPFSHHKNRDLSFLKIKILVTWHLCVKHGNMPILSVVHVVLVPQSPDLIRHETCSVSFLP